MKLPSHARRLSLVLLSLSVAAGTSGCLGSNQSAEMTALAVVTAPVWLPLYGIGYAIVEGSRSDRGTGPTVVRDDPARDDPPPPDAPPRRPRRLPWLGGFRHGWSVQRAERACVERGGSWQLRTDPARFSVRAQCSFATGRFRFAPGPVELAFCSGGELCAIAVGLRPPLESDAAWIALYSRAERDAARRMSAGWRELGDGCRTASGEPWLSRIALAHCEMRTSFRADDGDALVRLDGHDGALRLTVIQRTWAARIVLRDRRQIAYRAAP